MRQFGIFVFIIVIIGGFLFLNFFFQKDGETGLRVILQTLIGQEKLQGCDAIQDSLVRVACEKAEKYVAGDNQAVTQENFNDFSSLCVAFQDVSLPVSCEEAIIRAMIEIPGTVQKVSLGVVGDIPEFSNLPLPMNTQMWMVDIQQRESLETELQEQEELLQAGIPTNDPQTIYQRILP